MKLISVSVNEQDKMLIRKPGGDTMEVPVPEADRRKQTLTNAQILELAGYAKKIEPIMAVIWIWNGALMKGMARSGFFRLVRKLFGPAATRKRRTKKDRRPDPWKGPRFF